MEADVARSSIISNIAVAERVVQKPVDDVIFFGFVNLPAVIPFSCCWAGLVVYPRDGLVDGFWFHLVVREPLSHVAIFRLDVLAIVDEILIDIQAVSLGRMSIFLFFSGTLRESLP